jgi:hypothetical protein
VAVHAAGALHTFLNNSAARAGTCIESKDTMTLISGGQIDAVLCCAVLCCLCCAVLCCVVLMQVFEAVSPRLQDKPEVLAWLQRNTAPLKQQLAATTAAAQPAAMATA